MSKLVTPGAAVWALVIAFHAGSSAQALALEVTPALWNSLLRALRPDCN